jgi:hypothetical protein
MRKLRDLKCKIESAVRSFDAINGIRYEDYVPLYEKYLHELKVDCLKLADMLGYDINDNMTYNYYVIEDRRIGLSPNVRVDVKKEWKQLPSFHKNSWDKHPKLVNYISNDGIAIFFILELLELELPKEIQSKIDQYEK